VGPLVREAVPLRAIYRLAVRSTEGTALEEMPPLQRFRAVGDLSYNSHVAAALLDRAVHLERASAVANAVPMRLLRRPRGRWSVDELADLVAGT
jgi:hypothetical protein